MKTRLDPLLQKLVSFCMAAALVVSLVVTGESMAYAIGETAQRDFEKVSLALNSDAVRDNSIDLYVHDAIHYITMDDLCALTGSTQSADGSIITVMQGFWSAEFDVENQVFHDDCQTVDVVILEVSEDEYAVPALMFLSYFKAMAFIEYDTLYCRMAEYTAWEALNVDYGNSLVDIYELYGGEKNVTRSLTLDIIMDFVMGENPSTEDYLKSAYNAALDVDLYSYDAVKAYVENKNEVLYNDLVSEETGKMLTALSDLIKSADSTLDCTQEALNLLIRHNCIGQTTEFYNLAFDALDAGDSIAAGRYADQIASAWRDKEFEESLVGNNVESAEGALFLLSAAVEAAQQIKYAYQEDNLVYRVMGQDNMNKLALNTNSNEWFEIANTYENASAALGDTFFNALRELQSDAIQDLISEALELMEADCIGGIKIGVWKVGLEAGRIAAKILPFTGSTIEGFQADRQALYLSELQQNVYWILCHECARAAENPNDESAYSDYISAQLLYCRTSIAMYENLITMVNEFGNDRDYWTTLFQERIDMLAVSLYQLTMIQDDGVSACLPLDLSTFQYDHTAKNLQDIFLKYIGDAEQDIDFFWDDFDGDGVDEAYGVTGEQDEVLGLYNNVNIYFISADGTISHVNSDLELYGYCPSEDGLMEAGTSKFLLWEKSAGGSGSITYLFGVKNGAAYQPQISGALMKFRASAEKDVFSGYSSDFSQGFHDYITHYYTYDNAVCEFTAYESNGS